MKDAHACLVACRTLMPTMMRRVMEQRGRIITMLPPPRGTALPTARSCPPMCTRAATTRTISRAPQSTAGTASYPRPCSSEMAMRRVCVCVCLRHSKQARTFLSSVNVNFFSLAIYEFCVCLSDLSHLKGKSPNQTTRALPETSWNVSSFIMCV